jgi:hypothetical protein
MKVVKGLPLRSGSGPAAILWSLDSVIRMDYVGGNAIFRFSTLSAQSSIIAQNSVIEYDGDYFWVGIDRFLVYSGGKVQELPNALSKNWFFDNLNYAQRQKIWVTKVPRYGEIIWFFPYGDATECNRAIVFNVIEKTWYDFELSRTAGYYSQVFRYPVWAGDSSQQKSVVKLSGVTGTFSPGDSITNSDLETTSTVYSVPSATELVIYGTTPARQLFARPLDTLFNNSGTGNATVVSVTDISSAYIHEKGVDAVTEKGVLAIESYFETADFGFPTGVNQPSGQEGGNFWTRLVRVEPDFNQVGDMTMRVIQREFAQQDDIVSEPFTFGPETGKIDMRKQGRQIRLRFESNALNGNYEMGRTILHTEPGDTRT